MSYKPPNNPARQFWSSSAVVWAVATFDLMVGWECLGWCFSLCGTSGGDSLLLFFRFGCVVQILMGFLLVSGTIVQSERICRFYIHATICTLPITVPFIFRILELSLVQMFIDTMSEFKEYQKHTIIQIDNTTGIEEQTNGRHYRFTENYQPNPRLLQEHHVEQPSFNDTSRSGLSMNIHVRPTEQPATSITSGSVNGPPPAYYTCISETGVYDKEGIEDIPPPYNLAIQMLPIF